MLRRANPKRLRFISIDRLILGGAPTVSQDVWRTCNRPTGDRNPLASCGIEIVLAMEAEAPLRTTGRDGRNTPAYPPDERRQSVVGSRGSMASFSSLASMSARPAYNIWHGKGFLPRRDGGRSFVTMLMGSPRWTSSRCRQSRFGCSMADGLRARSMRSRSHKFFIPPPANRWCKSARDPKSLGGMT